MSLPAESMGLGSSCLARQCSARQAEATPGRTSRRVGSARQDEKGVPWFWKILYTIWHFSSYSRTRLSRPSLPFNAGNRSISERLDKDGHAVHILSRRQCMIAIIFTMPNIWSSEAGGASSWSLVPDLHCHCDGATSGQGHLVPTLCYSGA